MISRKEWLVLTDKEATAECRYEILRRAWDLPTCFLAEHMRTRCGSGPDAWELSMMKTGIDSEDKRLNESFLDWIVNGSGLDTFVKDAIQEFGRGGILSTFDRVERMAEIGSNTFYIYKRY